MDPSISSTGSSAGSLTPPYDYSYLVNIYLAYNLGTGVGLALLIAYLPPHLLSKIINRLWNWPLIMEAVRATTENQYQFGEAQDDESSSANQNEGDEEEEEEADDVPVVASPRKATYSLSNSASLSQPLNSSPAVLFSGSVSDLRRATSAEHGPAEVDTISDRLFMRPVPGRLLVMGRAIQLTNVDSTDPLLAPRLFPGPRSLASRVCLWLTSCLCSWIPSTIRHRSLSTRIVRIVRRILWIHTWSAVLYLLDLCVIRISRYQIPHVPLTDFDTRCPAETLGSYCFDHFTFAYVACYDGADNFVPRGTKLLECYQMLSPDASTVVSGIATVAALFSLVFGGMCAVMTWALGTVDRVWLLWSLYALPLFGVVMLEYSFFAAKVTSVIALFVTITAIVSFASIVRIRLLIIERTTKGGMDDSWADACVSFLGCARCIGPPNPVLTTLAAKDFHTVDL